MKKVIFSIMLLLVLILIVVVVAINDRAVKSSEVLTFNTQFEKYMDKTIYGADVLTIINKAIDNNETYDVEKDEKNFYIENNQNSLKVEIKLLSTDDKGKVNEVTHQMETLEKAGLEKFISSFNLTTFKCTNVEYNSNQRISKIYIKQLEI